MPLNKSINLHSLAGKKAIVIGAGIAGLATAARLAAKGFDVEVFEKNGRAGGKLGLLQQDGYTFDTGPSLFTQPYLLEKLFAECGRDLKQYLTYEALGINTHYFYEDGTQLNAFKEHTLLGKELKLKLGIDRQQTLNFLEEVKGLYNDIGTLFLNSDLSQASTWTSRNTLAAIKRVKWQYLLTSMHSYHTKKLMHPKLVQLFDRFATYNGSNPYQAPAMLCMIAHLEMNEGAFYPHGGMISIPQAMYRLCMDMGVQFHFNTAVEQITVVGNNVTGIVANGDTHAADIVVSNSDVYFTYKNLLHDEHLAGKMKQQERSSSAVIFYWGINKTFPKLGLHNILFAENYEAEFGALFKSHKVYHDPTIYINITAKMEATHAPADCENWFVLVNTPAGISDIDRIRKHTIDKINRMLQTDIENLLQTETIMDPAQIEKNTGSYMGALYGTSSNNPMAAFMRHGNASKKYKGLYFAGGTVHPGGGIPLCLRSARIVSDMICYK